MLNRTIFQGVLGRNPSVTVMDSGTIECTFSVLVTETYLTGKGSTKQQTSIVPVIAYNGVAKKAHRLESGRAVTIEGRLRTVDVGARTTLRVVATDIYPIAGQISTPVPACATQSES